MKCTAFVLALVTASAAVAARNPKIAPDTPATGAGEATVIIQYRTAPSAAHEQRVRARGGRKVADLESINSQVHRLPAAALDAIAEDPDVLYVSPDRKVRATLDRAAAAVNAGSAWSSGYTGSGIGIAVLDSGSYDHADLAANNMSRIVYSEDFTGENNYGVDTWGHGSHVMVIAGGNGNASTTGANFSGLKFTRTFKGLAPGAKLINLRVLGSDGSGSDSAVIAAINKAIKLKKTYNIRVMNLSLGRPVFESYKTDPLCQAVEAAWKSGIVVVVAAGNFGRSNPTTSQGYATIASPGNDPYVITVGAMKHMGTPSRTDDLIASYSSKGPSYLDRVVKPDLVAPGNLMVSGLNPQTVTITGLPAFTQTRLDLSAYTTQTSGKSMDYYTLNGTSMATPVVSGAAALMLQKNSRLTPDQVKARMMKTAYKVFPYSSTATDPVTGVSYTSYYDVLTVGAGYLDIAAALSNNDNVSGNALSPVLSNTGGATSLVFPTGSVFNSNLTWGTNLVWGVNQFVAGSATQLNGSNLVWGTTGATGYNLIWGVTSGLAGVNLVWGTTSSTIGPQSVLVQGE